MPDEERNFPDDLWHVDKLSIGECGRDVWQWMCFAVVKMRDDATQRCWASGHGVRMPVTMTVNLRLRVTRPARAGAQAEFQSHLQAEH